MSMNRRLDAMASAVQARHGAAWDPLINYISDQELPEGAFALMRSWENLSGEKQRVGWGEVEETWGTEEEVESWRAWWREFDAALAKKGIGSWPRLGPGQVPLSPDEPSGLFERLCGFVRAPTSAGPRREAAAHALLWLSVARSLRRFELADTP